MKKFIEKIKAFMSKIIEVYHKIKNWVAIDGLLHILVSMVLVLSLAPFIRLIWAIIVAALIGLAKEYKDVFVDGDNTKQESLKDIACDAIGIIFASIIYALGSLITLF